MIRYVRKICYPVSFDRRRNGVSVIFQEDINLLQNSSSPVRTNVRRLIMVYDYLKWGK